MARLFVVLLAAFAVSVIALPADAQWKWRDKGGHVQYSDLPPPPGTPDQDILGRPTPSMRRTTPTAATPAPTAPAASATAAPTPKLGGADAELEAKRKKAEADAAAKAKADQERVAAMRAENCNRAKTHLATLESGVRLVQANAKTGEREYLDDKQRADEVRRTRDVIATDCK